MLVPVMLDILTDNTGIGDLIITQIKLGDFT